MSPQALNEVSRVFQEASRALSGDVENRLGMVCMSRGQHSEAMKHFRRASHHENAVAAYNMGQCYELGLGTSRNLKKVHTIVLFCFICNLSCNSF